jgi:BirA family biotin operon repressor/biotin-[acetyl-CoA-carboxylase] ligase
MSTADDAALLAALRRAGGRGVSGSLLGARLGLTRAGVHKRIARLRGDGYRVRGTNRLGYRLDSSSDVLEAPARGPLGRPFFRFSALPSTQDEAKRLAVAGAAEGTLVAADRQTAGRGRLGRRWESPVGGLWFSVVLRPPLPPDRVPALALVAALDWVRVLRRRTGLPALVKWPNDVWVRGRKVAGLLTEMSSEVDRVHWVVLGAGLNVNNRPPRRTASPAGSLSAFLARRVPRNDLLRDWLAEFGRSYARFRAGGFAPFRKDFDRHSLLRGRPVVCRTAEGTVRGRALGVDASGRLRVNAPGGVRVVWEGEASPLLRVRGRWSGRGPKSP